MTKSQNLPHRQTASITPKNTPLLILLGGQAIIYLAIAATNIADLTFTAGWYDGDWHSGNVGFVQSLLDNVGEPKWFAVATVCFAALFEATAGVYFARAAIAMVRSTATSLQQVRRAVSIALFLWMVLAFGIEAFIAYPDASWESFFLIAFLAVVTWWSAEFLLNTSQVPAASTMQDELDKN